MKKQIALLFTSLCLGLGGLHAEDITVSFVDAQGASVRRDQQNVSDKIVLNGTGAEATFKVKTTGLIQDVSVKATNGFKVEPATIQAGLDEEITVTVTHLTSLASHEGKVILRSGDKRAYVKLNGYGTPLEVKDISEAPIYNGGKDANMTFDADALNAEKGYTIEIKAKTAAAGAMVRPYGLTNDGVGFKSYIGSTAMGMYNGANTFISDETISNPSNGGTFYNTDGLYHTYRYAVTPDKRVFVYRDGIAVDTFRLADLALQPEWTVENGDVEKNLLKNGDFEGEWDFSESRNIVTRIEGWDVYPYDQYNSTQEIIAQERDNEVDQNNHVLSIDRYMWNAGWAAGEVSQIVDVAPNEIYSFSALAKGGMKDGESLGSLRIYDLQNADNTVTIPVTGDSYQKYAADFETKANTKQIRVSFYLERASWGASVSSLEVDDAKLTGVRRLPQAQLGFENLDGDVAYFAYDATGAYAPAFAELGTSVSKLDIDGTGNTGTFKVNAANLTGDISVSATHGFTVSPTRIAAGTTEATVTVTHLTSLASHEGKVILRSGDKRAYVKLNGYGTPLEVKDISEAPIYNGGKDANMTFDADALNAEKGYTIEIKAKTAAAGAMVRPYGLTNDGVGFKSYIGSTAMGMYNGANTFISDETISNPSNGGTFYNTDGLYHTYRYAVTPDKRVFVYRDGIAVDTFRLADLALQPEWTVENGDVEKNLLKNGDFEGEWDFSESRNIVTRIEGWDVYPYDQYNSTQEIIAQERDNEVDQNNHVLSIDRYMWNAGWAAGEVSQIVDVAPNEIYSFSALAKGGMKDGESLGSLRIYDLQNADNTVTIPVTGDSYQKYAADFETKANTKQIRVSFYLERASWGASVSSLEVDDAKLTGVRRLPQAQLGFENLDGDVAYFAYDATGAYAPMMPGLTISEIQTALEHATISDGKVTARVEDGMLILNGTHDGAMVLVYNRAGAMTTNRSEYIDGMEIALPERGVYIVAVIYENKKHVVKVVY